MPSNRREFLRLGGLTTVGALAGCLSNAKMPDELPDRGSDDEKTPAGDTRPSGTGGPGVSIVETDDAPAGPAGHAVELVEDTATAEHPPRLRVTVTNDGDEPITLGEGRAVVFSYVTDDGDSLVLLPSGGEYAAEPDCWRLTEGVAVTMEYRSLGLDPGESVSQELDLYATKGGDGCLPVGDFRFETTYQVAAGEKQPGDGDTASWGFTLQLE